MHVTHNDYITYNATRAKAIEASDIVELPTMLLLALRRQLVVFLWYKALQIPMAVNRGDFCEGFYLANLCPTQNTPANKSV